MVLRQHLSAGLAWEGPTALGPADTYHPTWRVCGAWMSRCRHHSQSASTALTGPCSHCGLCSVSRAEDPEEEVPQDLRLFLSKGGGRDNLRPLGSGLLHQRCRHPTVRLKQK